jgi:hypothetical protein
MKKALLVTILFSIMAIPVASAQLSGAWVQEVDYESVVNPGETVIVNVTIGYSFDNVVEISPGIYSRALDDWVVDDFVYVNGTSETSYILEFLAPGISGSHEYEANVYYFIDGNWFNLGKGAFQNMTLEVTGTVTTLGEYSVEIEEITVSETIGIDEAFLLEITVRYDFDEETDIDLLISDPVSGNVVVETQDTLEGNGVKVYSFNMTSPLSEGVYQMEASVLYFNGLEWGNPEDNAVQRISQEVIIPKTPGIPITYIGIGILVVVVAGYIYYMKSKKS